MLGAMDIQQQAIDALLEPDPSRKGALIRALHTAVRSGVGLDSLSANARAIDIPGIPAQPRLVHPRKLGRRGTGTEVGRLALVHAIAHIEFNAMNLALDAAVRYADLPGAFYGDWIGVAADEARHFELLQARMQALGARYGDFPAHQGLWDMALRTADDPLDRMALVPRIMEARGLDVTPGMIGQFQRAGDVETVAILELILEEEVAHVEAGTRWFRYLCDRRGLDPDTTWFARVAHYLGNDIRCPLNYEDRGRAGFRQVELDWLEQACKGQRGSQ